jgi:hypothetical protein
LAHAWRINGLGGRRKSFVLSAHLAHNCRALPEMDRTRARAPQENRSRMSSHSMRETSSLRNTLRTVSVID